ncbi:uncharacterized protein LOC111470386 isoform X2 [Cucurbita maxima]|uniref:Uncharacterized protein LOC111470386 isoform X2 n=1 Tax=Cucurbita maxima TaxID=3661 RepID=A0A6J1I7T4_CUCMA|nr:uncharacterized protein LOC111470386 isoform X2 [Cucurbita maxima]
MDLWVVATAAGAGYLAKYWQKLLRDGNSSSQMSSRNSINEEVRSLDHPFHETARRTKASRDILPDEGEVLNERDFDTSLFNVASTNGFDCEKMESLGNYQDYNDLRVSDLPLELSLSKDPRAFGHRSSMNVNMDDNITDQLPCSSSRELNWIRPTVRKIGSLRRKRSCGRFIRPLSSLDSCVLSHLYKEHIEMEEYILHSFQSPSESTRRQLVVNGGTRMVSRAARDSFSVQVDMDASNFHKEPLIEKNRNVCGLPLLPKIQSLKNYEMIDIKGERRQGGASSGSQMHNEKLLHGEDRMLPFYLGFSIGLISSYVANKREIDKLKELLKHTENLVQDLQEELEMKDSVTVKELSNENCESLDISENSFFGRRERNLNSSAKSDDKELFEQNAEEGSESLSKIEAELEAELQRLGLNTHTTSTDKRFSDLHELEQEFAVDFSEGNHTVSPWELSLRLHEVIQSRLEARVRELETALENSERKLQRVETKQINSWKGFTPSELLVHSSSEESLTAQPLVMNLAGEALDAYNEAYNELIDTDDSEEELVCPPSAVDESKHRQSNTTTNGHRFSIPTSLSRILVKEKMKDCDYKVQQSNDEDESSDYDDEMEKQLIKQIVEKTRKGSPVVLNAQRWLFSMDKDNV